MQRSSYFPLSEFRTDPFRSGIAKEAAARCEALDDIIDTRADRQKVGPPKLSLQDGPGRDALGGRQSRCIGKQTMGWKVPADAWIRAFSRLPLPIAIKRRQPTAV